MSYDSEQREDERRTDQERRSPKPHGDIITEDDFVEWEKRRKELLNEESILPQLP
jgi:hypothetical protein